MHIISFGVSKRLADVFDAVLDRYNKNEEAMAHACIRVLVHFGESINDEQSDEICQKLSQYMQDDDEGDDADYLQREIIVDAPTYKWLQVLSDAQSPSPDIEMVFMNGVILTSIMLEVVQEKPTAHLTRLLTSTHVKVPIRQILHDARPQFYN